MRKRPRLLATTICIACGNVHRRDSAFAILCWACVKAQSILRSHANRQLISARLRGDIAPPTQYACVDCSRPAKLYDHRSYVRPLDVQPVCHSCNVRRGPTDDFSKFAERAIEMRAALFPKAAGN